MAFGADRTVTVRLKALVSDYIGNVPKATKATTDLADAGTKMGAQHKAAWTTVGQVTAVGALGIAAAVGAAVKTFADFDKEMSNVRAVSGATAAEMKQLSDAALEAGAKTKFSASDAAEAEAELTKAGVSTTDILKGGLTGALNLAAAGNLDLATAATTSARAMNLFGLKGTDVSHIADVLAAGANKSAADISDLSLALQQGGLVASQTGLKLEDTVGILSANADNALISSDAGTSLKTMLQRLVPQSAEASAAMKDIGLNAYDAQGNFIGLDKVADQLQTGLGSLTQQQRDSTLATIFGSDAVRGANVLYKLGAAGVRDYTKSVNDNGAAARVAAIQMDNLSGDLENLRGSIETALIKGGSGANDGLRSLVQGVNGAVNSFSSLPPVMQESAVKIAAVAAGVVGLGAGLGVVIPKAIALKEALDTIAASSGRAATALGLVGKAATLIGVAAAAVELNKMGAAATQAAPATDHLAQGLLDVGNAADESRNFGELFARGLGVFRNDFESTGEAIKDFGANANAALNPNQFEQFFGQTDRAQTVFTDRVHQIDAALVQLVQSGHAKEAASAVDQLSQSITMFGGNQDQVRSQFTGYNDALKQAATSTGAVGDAARQVLGPGRDLTSELKAQKDAADAAKQKFDDLTNAVKGYGDQVSAALSASAGYEQAIDDAAGVAKKRKEIQDQIAALQKEQGNVADINKKYDTEDAKTRRDAEARLKSAKTQDDRTRIQQDLADTLSQSKASRDSALAAKDNSKQIADLQEQLKQYTATLDITTDAGRNNQKMLLDIASSAKDSAVENFKNGDSVDQVAKKMDGARGAFIAQAQQFGATRAEAEKLADKLGLTRENVDQLRQAAPATVTVNANDQATPAMQSITRQLADLNGKTATVSLVTSYSAVNSGANQKINDRGYASGGYTGDGPVGQVAGVVHGQEYVLKAPAVARLGTSLLDGLNAGRLVSAPSVPTGPASSNTTNDNRIFVESLTAHDVADFEIQADRRRRLAALGGRRG